MNFFSNAKPIWLEGRETERHLRVQFKSFFNVCDTDKKHTVKIATSGIYQLFINGKFVAYGPARAGKYHFRVDEIDVSKFIKSGKNTAVIEVAGYYTTTFYIMQQPSFLQAEIFCDSVSLNATGSDFTARVNPYYIQKAEKYSYQRPQLEIYRLKDGDTFFTDDCQGTETIAETEEKTLIGRRADYPIYEELNPVKIGNGKVVHLDIEPQKNRTLTVINSQMTGYKYEELDMCVNELMQTLDSEAGDFKNNDILSNDEYALFELPYNASGMLRFDVECKEDTTLLIGFDEILGDDGKLHPLRFDVTNGIYYELKPGKYHLQFFEVYTMKYIAANVLKGSCEFKNLTMVEFKHPPVKHNIVGKTPEIQKIIDAAVETYKQNAVDLFTDCPSRERAGWLCDSFFLGRVAYCLDGNCDIETDFLENFLHEENFEALPEGMVHMSYPGDHRNGNFIPNWAMWMVLQLEEYAVRAGNRELIDRFKVKVEKLLKYFEALENEDGLLEKLRGWIFVEWSRANQLVQDVNYPSNMMYSKILKIAGKLYDRPEWIEKGEKIKNEVLKQSWNGKFFVDNAVRDENGKLVLSGETTEVCQYYAYFCDIVTTETHKDLFDTLLNDFGPHRKIENKWPDVHFANVLPGSYMRLEILMQHGYKDKVLEEIVGYFLYMAERTGTLWEHDDTSNSCCHGFASHVLCWLDKM